MSDPVYERLLEKTMRIDEENRENNKFHVTFDLEFAGPEEDLGMTFDPEYDAVIPGSVEMAFTEDDAGVLPTWWKDNKVSNVQISDAGEGKRHITFDVEFAGPEEDLGMTFEPSYEAIIPGSLRMSFTEDPTAVLPEWWKDNKVSNVQISGSGEPTEEGKVPATTDTESTKIKKLTEEEK